MNKKIDLVSFLRSSNVYGCDFETGPGGQAFQPPRNTSRKIIPNAQMAWFIKHASLIELTKKVREVRSQKPGASSN